MVLSEIIKVAQVLPASSYANFHSTIPQIPWLQLRPTDQVDLVHAGMNNNLKSTHRCVTQSDIRSRLTVYHNTQPWRFGRSFSFLNGWVVGSMLNLPDNIHFQNKLFCFSPAKILVSGSRRSFSSACMFLNHNLGHNTRIWCWWNSPTKHGMCWSTGFVDVKSLQEDSWNTLSKEV